MNLSILFTIFYEGEGVALKVCYWNITNNSFWRILPPTETIKEERRSPSPKRQKSPVREPSPAPSLTESVSESSVSDTVNQSVSEGQWLLNKSEGEVADFPIDEGKTCWPINEQLDYNIMGI